MKINISISLNDEQGELKRSLDKLNEKVEQAYERLEEKEVDHEFNLNDKFLVAAANSSYLKGIEKLIDDIEEADKRNFHDEIKYGVQRALKRVGVVRPKLNAADLIFQGLYGSCDFEGINSPVLDKYFKVVRVPGWVYYKMNKGVKK